MSATRKSLRSAFPPPRWRRHTSNHPKWTPHSPTRHMCSSARYDRPLSRIKTRDSLAKNSDLSRNNATTNPLRNIPVNIPVKRDKNTHENELVASEESEKLPSRKRWATTFIYVPRSPTLNRRTTRKSTTDDSNMMIDSNIVTSHSKPTAQRLTSSSSTATITLGSGTDISLNSDNERSLGSIDLSDLDSTNSITSWESASSTIFTTNGQNLGSETNPTTPASNIPQNFIDEELAASLPFLSDELNPLPMWAQRNVVLKPLSVLKVQAKMTPSYIRSNAHLVLKRALCTADVVAVRTLAAVAPNALIGAAGEAALVTAAEEGQTAMVGALLALGVDADASSARRSDRDGWAPLHAAAYYGHAACVAALVRAGARVDAATPAGLTPLHLAALHNRAPCAAALLAAGAPARTPDSAGKTPAAYAQQFAHDDVLAVLRSRAPPTPISQRATQ